MCERIIPQTVWDLSESEGGDQVNRTEHLGWIDEAKCFGSTLGARERDSRELKTVDSERSVLVHIEPPD